MHTDAEERTRSDVPVACGNAVAGVLRARREQARSSCLVVAVLDYGALLVAARQALAHDFALQDATLFNGDVLREAAALQQRVRSPHWRGHWCGAAHAS